MEQWLQRGKMITIEKRIKRMISYGQEWQIYLTNRNSYVLVVTASLYTKWIEKYFLPKDIFAEVNDKQGYWMVVSSNDYIIASLAKGPFPKEGNQIEAFSIVFNQFVKRHPTGDLCNAIYIEEYSLLLPTQEGEEIANDVAYGRWLTGGVVISAKNFDRVSMLMSWMSREELEKYFGIAGFDIINKTKELLEDEHIELIPGHEKERFSLIGRPELERFFNENIIDVVTQQERYNRMGITFPGATILYGPPGCGKTYAVERLVEYLGWKRFDIDSSTVASSYIHDTSKKIAEVFNAAIKAAPSVIVIDEMEAFLSNRNATLSTGLHHIEEVAEFLRRIPEAISKGVLIFAMTNMIDSIDPAILRRGRFDYIIEVKMANSEEIMAFLNMKFTELPIASDVDVYELAKRLDGHPMSDVTFILREAGMLAVKSKKELIDRDSFDKAITMLPKQETKRKIGFN